MTHTYQISGMTCSGCEAKVTALLLGVPGVESAEVSHQTGTGTLHLAGPVALSTLQDALGGTQSKYRIDLSQNRGVAVTETKTLLGTYSPILLIFGYITAVVLLVQSQNASIDVMQAMRHFMSGFFLVFSFFKLLNIKGFAESYAMYDVLARKIPAWGYAYAFIELGLGIAYLIDFNPLLTNLVSFAVMSLSIIGVLQSVLNKRKIRCACLGAVFNLPMSTVTIIEDAMMIAMSAAMIAQLA